MTVWNPLNVFSNSQRRAAGNDPSASFDPSRIGDPIGSDHVRPAIGFGDTSVGGTTDASDPGRRPIGFAPPEDTDAAGTKRRYSTEISFKRHHELPRASAIGGDEDGSTQEPWLSPGSDVHAGFEGPDGVAAEDGVEAPVEEAVEAKVPFYKREIGFHRKSETPEEAADGLDLEAKKQTELAAHADQTVARDEHDELDAEALAEPDAPEVAEVHAEELFEDEFESESEETVAEVDAPSDVVDESLSADVDNGKAPFYKREISFRRKSTEKLDAVDDPSDAGPLEVVAATEALNDDVVAESDADSTPAVLEVAASEVAPVAAAFDGPEPGVAEAGMSDPDTSEPQTSGDGDDLFPEDTPPAKRRLSRKERRAVAVPKRKPSRGGTKGRRVVGLKIGASQLAAAVIAETDAGHELVDLARRPLEAGIVVDGEVRDAAALSRAIKEFFDEENLPKKDVRIGLASNRIGVRTFDIVGIDDETRFDNAVRFKAHEVLPVAAHESVLDYRVLEERPNEAGEPIRRVLLVVAPRDQVEPYAEVARQAGITLSGIDLEALGLLRTFVDPKPFAARKIDDTATVIVSIGHESSTLLVAGGGACEFTRVFDWGGSVLVSAIATALEVQPAEAATILKHLSLSGPGRQLDGLDEVTRAKALDAVRLRLTPFARELVNSLQFYQTQDGSLGIAEIVITGGTSHLEGLGEVLHQMVGVNVSIGDPLGRVISTGEYDSGIEAVMGSMAVPIGLAISDVAMRAVNLLPTDAVKKRSRRSSLIAIGAPAAVAVPLVALGMLYFGAHGKAADSQAELDAVKAEIAALPKPTGPDIDASVVGDEAARATALASVLGGRLAWDSVFRDLGRVLPANVWLKSLSATLAEGTNLADGTTAAAAAAVPGQSAPAPSAVVIEGYTYSQPDVARLLARLATLPSLKRVALTSSQRETVGKKDVVRFVIVADLSQTGGAS